MFIRIQLVPKLKLKKNHFSSLQSVLFDSDITVKVFVSGRDFSRFNFLEAIRFYHEITYCVVFILKYKCSSDSKSFFPSGLSRRLDNRLSKHSK